MKFGVFVSRISCITLIVFYLLYFPFFVILLLIIHLSICMKLDPGIHIVMHWVLSEKLGVTEVVSEPGSTVECKPR